MVMKKEQFITLWLCVAVMSLAAQTGRVGINTLTPAGMLHVADSSVVFTGANTLPGMPGDVPVSGAGVRMMWYPDKAAFRSGFVSGTAWDKDSIGVYSFASGFNTKAMSTYAVAFGQQTIANGLGSFALGRFTRASVFGAMAGGRETLASGQQASAFGRTTTASGTNATSFGLETIAAGISAVAMGFQTQALLDNSVAMGSLTIAGGINGLATGESTFAGNNALATGYFTTSLGNSFSNGTSTQANGLNSVATGNLTVASGNQSLATGDRTNATGENAVSAGFLTSADGDASMTYGTQNISTGNNALSGGFFNQATGDGGVALGHQNIVAGDYAMTLGENLVANSFASMVLGRYNDTIGVSSSTMWVADDPLLVVGGGFVDNNLNINRVNTAVLTKNGNLVLNPNGPPEARLDVNGTVKIGFEGTPLQAVGYAAVIADLPPIPSGVSYVQSFSFTAGGTAVSVSPELELPDGLIIAYSRRLGSQVQTKFINVSAGLIDVPAMTYYIMAVN